MSAQTSPQALRAGDRNHVNRRTIIRSKSPLRLSFGGGGTDLPHYYEEHGGAVLSSTINRFSYVTLYPREDNQVLIRSLDLGYTVKYSAGEVPIFDGLGDLAKAAIRRIGSNLGFELDIQTEAPPGSGLGGSSAVTSAVIGALVEYSGLVLDQYELAELNYTIERVDLSIAGGKQDQYATTFGGFNLIEFQKDKVLVTPLRIPRDVLNDLACHLMLCYTGKVRPALGLIDAQVRYYKEKRATTLEGMRRIHEMTYEMKEALLKGRLLRFGELLDEAQLNKKRMNPHVMDGALDGLCELAKQHGAVAGKLCGAGGGGYLLLFVQGQRRHEVRQALEEAGCQFADFGFDDHGLQVWRSQCP
jgi:D-glycero-alpha-D-manno-heptose-7-phosphate kinase